MSVTFSQYLGNYSSAIPKYPNAAALPAASPNGSLAVTLDTSSLYIFVTGTGWEILSSGGETVIGMGTFGSSPNSSGGTIAGNLLTLQPANGSFPGGVSTGTQTFGGDKLFMGNITTPSITLTGATSGALPILPAAVTTSYHIILPGAQGGANTTLRNDGAGNLSWADLTSGTVTSVALTLPNIFSVSGSPITTSGTLLATLATQSANAIFAGPTTGAAAAPTFRALVSADVPTINLAAGGAGGVTGTLPIGNGGTGRTTANAALNALLPSQASQSGNFLTTDGTNTSWAAAGGSSLPADWSVFDAFTLQSSNSKFGFGGGSFNMIFQFAHGMRLDQSSACGISFNENPEGATASLTFYVNSGFTNPNLEFYSTSNASGPLTQFLKLAGDEFGGVQPSTTIANSFTLSAMDGLTSGAVNGGNISITSGAAGTGGTAGAVLLQAGGTTYATLGITGLFTDSVGIQTPQYYSKETGTNDASGTGTLVGGTVTITTSKAVAPYRLMLTDTAGGVFANIGVLTAVKASGSFTVTSTNPLDTSTFDWMIIQTY